MKLLSCCCVHRGVEYWQVHYDILVIFPPSIQTKRLISLRWLSLWPWEQYPSCTKKMWYWWYLLEQFIPAKQLGSGEIAGRYILVLSFEEDSCSSRSST
jgi:hypothetical protein